MPVRLFTHGARLAVALALTVVASLVWVAPSRAIDLTVTLGDGPALINYDLTGCTGEEAAGWVADATDADGQQVLTVTGAKAQTSVGVPAEELGYGWYQLTVTCLGYDDAVLGTVSGYFPVGVPDAYENPTTKACVGQSVTLWGRDLLPGVVLTGSLTANDANYAHQWPAATTVAADGTATLTVTIPQDAPVGQTLVLAAADLITIDGTQLVGTAVTGSVTILPAGDCAGPSPLPSTDPSTGPSTLPSTGR